MGKNSYRKPRPSIPNHAWLDLDNCWFCNNRKNCNNCKVMKKINAQHKEKKKKKEKQELRKYLGPLA